MTINLTNYLGLLRTVVSNMETRPLTTAPEVAAYIKERGFTQPSKGEGLTSIKPAGHEAFNGLAERLVEDRPAMARGAIFANVQVEVFNVVAGYEGPDPARFGTAEAQAFVDHFDAWFADLAKTRRFYVPCVLTPWPAPSFEIGPVRFVFGADVAASDLYPATSPNAMAREHFDDMLREMARNQANWLARVTVDGCEQERGKDLGNLAVDLAIVGLQLAAPRADTRNMSRMASRRGSALTQSIVEANGNFGFGQARTEPGLTIGEGALQHFLKVGGPIAIAVGNIVRSFASGQWRRPALEQSWCDAAYWLHEALVESVDNIAITKLETALEVLMRSGNGSGSEKRILTVLKSVFGLGPDDPLFAGKALTARQFAKGLVRDRSRVLHGTWSTLNTRLGTTRPLMEAFAITVMARAATELERYANQPGTPDNTDAFLASIKPPAPSAAP